MQRKGQAAMEFLMTYGWAILAAIIAIGVLAYFGVFSPGKFVPTATVLNPPLYANSWNMKADVLGSSVVSIEVRNNGGEAINVQAIELSNSNSGAGAPCDDITTYAAPGLPISPGQLEILTVTCGTALVSGDTFKADIAVTYRKSGGTLDLSSTGTIAGTIIP